MAPECGYGRDSSEYGHGCEHGCGYERGVASVSTGPDRDQQTVRHAMVDFLQSHSVPQRPPACPQLEPIRYMVMHYLQGT